jgi:hypothetical protein
VRVRFAWPKVASDMKAVYDWVLGGGPKPGCILRTETFIGRVLVLAKSMVAAARK